MTTRLKLEEVMWRIKTAFANPAGAGDNSVIAAPGVGFKIVVYGYQVWNNADTAQTVIFRSGVTPVYPSMVLGVSTGAKTDYDCSPGAFPIFECAENQALNANLAAATAVGVAVQHCIERI